MDEYIYDYWEMYCPSFSYPTKKDADTALSHSYTGTELNGAENVHLGNETVRGHAHPCS